MEGFLKTHFVHLNRGDIQLVRGLVDSMLVVSVRSSSRLVTCTIWVFPVGKKNGAMVPYPENLVEIGMT